MKVELEADESWELTSLIVARLLEEAPLPASDRAKVRRWRSDAMRPGGEALASLARKLNEDLAQAIGRKKRSQLRRPDWR